MSKNYTLLEANGVSVRIGNHGLVYVTINGTTVYFENGPCGLILNLWTDDMEPDTAIDLVECMEYSNNSEVK